MNYCKNCLHTMAKIEYKNKTLNFHVKVVSGKGNEYWTKCLVENCNCKNPKAV